MMRKILLATALMALASTPAWALPGKAPTNGGTAHAPETTPVGPPSSTPNSESNPGSKNRSETGTENAGGGEHRGTSTGGESSSKGSEHRSSGKGQGTGKKGGKGGKSHHCQPHAVAYIVGGTLVSQTLTEEEGSHHTYKGEVTIEIKRSNHHALADKGTTKTYTVEGVHVSGPLKVAALEAGDWAQAIGRVTVLPKKCDAGEFKPTVTIRRLIFHGPHKSTTTTTTTTSSTTSGT